jgi:carbonic anhydrase
MQFKPYLGFGYLKKELATIFQRKYLLEDTFAGLTVTCIAIPLSLAIAMASGVEPGLGLISAIIGGIIAAFLGGTRLAVTGPAAAMAILIASTVETYGLTGLLITGIICGILQILFGVLRLGHYTKLVPIPVIIAFTAGIGFIIFVGQLPKAMQLPTPDQNHVIDVIIHIGKYFREMNPIALAIALATLAILKIMPLYFPTLPNALIAVAIPSLIVYFVGIPGIKLIGAIPHTLPIPHLPNFATIRNWSDLIISSFTIFGLASLETLLSSSSVDNMNSSGDMHNSNQELIGQGAANTAVALFGGLPVTGVIARSTLNIEAGAKTRRSAIIHSLAILAAIYFFPGLIEKIPVATLAGVLFSVTLSMMDWRKFYHFWKTDRHEAIICLTTFLAIIVTDLIKGVQAGIMIAFLILAIRMLKNKTNIHLWTNQMVMRIELSGALAFWSFNHLNKLRAHIKKYPKLRFVIFDFSGLHDLDSSGAIHLINVSNLITAGEIKVIFHALGQKEIQLLKKSSALPIFWMETHSENEITEILEKSGVPDLAQDALRHSIQKALIGATMHHTHHSTHIPLQTQKPHTLLITCSDNSLNPNVFLSKGPGDLFIVRNIGNIVPPYTVAATYSETAAIDFALNNLGIRNIVICAHTECAAIKAVTKANGTNNSNLNGWLKLIGDSFVKHTPKNDSDSIKINMLRQVENLKTYPLVIDLLAKNQLTISALMFEVHSTTMLEWNDKTSGFTPWTTPLQI